MGNLSCLQYFASGTQCRQLPSTESVAGPAAMRCGRGRTRSTRDTLQSPRHDLWALGLCTPEMFMAAVISLEPRGLSWHTPGPLSSYLGRCQLPPVSPCSAGPQEATDAGDSVPALFVELDVFLPEPQSFSPLVGDLGTSFTGLGTHKNSI